MTSLYLQPSRHPDFALPSPDTIIWRYIDLAKLVDLLRTNELFFALAGSFNDPLEGRIPDQDATKWPEAWVDGFRRNTVVSCWHINDHESDAMWKVYSDVQTGVAIKSTAQRLIDALPQYDPSKEKAIGNQICVGKVNYIDYQTDPFAPKSAKTYYSPFIHKHVTFEHEAELRAVVQAQMFSDKYPAFFPPPPHFTYPTGYPDGGLRVPVDTNRLIEEIRTPPAAEDWFIEAVRATVRKFNSAINVTPSFQPRRQR